MKIKKLLMLFILAATVSLIPIRSYADHSDTARVVDNAGILSEEEYNKISEILTEVSEKNDLDIVLFYENATPDEYNDKYGDQRAMYYCADLYDYGGYTDNGLALLITVEERKWALVTEGSGDSVFNGTVQGYISEDFLPYLKESDFAGAGREYADYVSYYLSDSESSDDIYTYNGNSGSLWLTMHWNLIVIIALIAGLLVAAIKTARLSAQLKSVANNNQAAHYVIKDSLKLRAQFDTYLYTTVTRTERTKDDDKATSFTSSSGDSHTGSSGDF